MDSKTIYSLYNFGKCDSVFCDVHTINVKLKINTVYIFCVVPTGKIMNTSHASVMQVLKLMYIFR